MVHSEKPFEEEVAAGMRADGSEPESDNPVHHLQRSLSDAYKRRNIETIDDETPASACLKPLLLALDWAGMARHLMEAMPHLEPVQDINDLRALLARLNYNTTRRSMQLSEIGPGMLPCLIAGEAPDDIHVVIAVEDDGKLLVFNGARKKFEFATAEDTEATVYLIEQICDREQQHTTQNYGWINTIFGRFRKVFAKLLALTFVINVLALSVPLYIMMVYDKAIGAKSPMTLFFFLAGLAIIMGGEQLLRSMRGRTVAFLGARFESVVKISAFQQLLHLPITMTENSSISDQITRLKQFGNIRDLFVGQLGNAILDLPFIFVFLAAIFFIGGSLGYLPLALLGVFLAMAAITIPLARGHVRRAGDARTNARSFLMELTENHASIGDSAAEDVWVDRYKKICSTALLGQFRAQQFSMIVQTVSQMLVMATGVLTVTIGAVQAMNGDLSGGALIALVALIWRLLSPLQAVFLGLNQIERMLDTFRQINNLMRLTTERRPGHIPTFDRNFQGHISLVGAGFRYSAHTEPAISNLTMTIEPGQIVAVTGNSGAGKSTFLKLVAGLYAPHAGVVRIDGLDLRQIDTAQYRQAIGYVPEPLEFFHGTIAQNLLLADPLATRADMEAALDKAGIGDVVDSLPDGLDTRLKSVDRDILPSGFLQQLSLARAYVKDCKIYLFDDPGSRLDVAADAVFMRHLKSLARTATVLLVTHRPSHMKCADRVIVLNRGQVAADGPPEEIVPALMSEMQTQRVS